MEREFISLNIAMLAIADDSTINDASIVKVISERMKAEGHQIAAREIVKDTEVAIRQQLKKWIADPNIDVVIAAADVESEAAPAALAPLITKSLPGFIDLFRLLAFQEIGASAVQSNAEAAECGSTVVFVLPASIAAVTTAMDKLLVPQLDHRTKPRNLVMTMPRVTGRKPLVKSIIPTIPPILPSIPSPVKPTSIPEPIENEKTAAGVGLAKKLPATPARRDRPMDDQPTRPIELEKLLPLMSSGTEPSTLDAPTKEILLAGLPRVPPGADEFSDDETDNDVLVFAPPVAVPTPPLRTIVPRKQQVAAAAEAATKPDSSRVTGASPTARVDAAAAARAAEVARVAARNSEVTRVADTVQIAKLAELAANAAATPTVNDVTDEALTARAPDVVVEPDRSTRAAATHDDELNVEPSVVDVPSHAAAVTRSPPPPVPSAVTAQAAVAPPPPQPTKSQPLSPPEPPVRPSSSPARPANTATGTIGSPGDLPRGAFVYPTKRKNRRARTFAFLLGGLALASGGFVAVVHFFPNHATSATATPADRVVAITPPVTPDATPVPVVIPPDATQTEIAMEPVEAPPPEPTPPAPEAHKKPASSTKHANKPPPKDPVIALKPPPPTEPPVDAKPAAEPVAEPKPPVAVADGCDEMTCVMEKYNRPCCEKYKPADTGFKPKSVVRDSLDRSMVMAGVERVKPRVIACGEKIAAKGTVKLSLTVSSEGDVADIKVTETPDPDLGTCVSKAMRKAKFGKTTNGGTFNYPFVF